MIRKQTCQFSNVCIEDRLFCSSKFSRELTERGRSLARNPPISDPETFLAITIHDNRVGRAPIPFNRAPLDNRPTFLGREWRRNRPNLDIGDKAASNKGMI